MPEKHYEWRLGDTLPTLGEHSLAKHRIIDRYLRRYIEICTATPVQEKLNFTIVDGYSGGGRYRYAGGEMPGSPIILLNAVAEMQERLNKERKKGFQIQTDFIFVDSAPLHTEFLREEIKNSPFAQDLDDSIQIWTGDFNELVHQTVNVARKRSLKGRSIFLLDQYGWSNVAFESIRTILSNLEKAEIFLTFNVDGLIDYMSIKQLQRDGYNRIGADPGFVRELLSAKEESAGWRTLIQNGLYTHIQQETGAEFYSPFFIRSRDAHRSYWFLHLSRHREARNEIGNIHWAETNTSLHYGRAGLQALGFSPGDSPEQLSLGYAFDEHARARSIEVLTDQIPRLIHSAIDADLAPSLEDLFGAQCNDTPVTRSLFEKVLKDLRDLGEVRIENPYGKEKPRAQSINWTDRIILARQTSFFGPFGPAPL